jgi:hypothetical protein
MQNKSVNTYLQRQDPSRRVPGKFPVNRLRGLQWFRDWKKTAKTTDAKKTDN